MRMPNASEDLVGKICVCSVGRLAIVIGTKAFAFGECWVGIGLDGKGIWTSSAPCVIAENAKEFHDKLVERFGGKMGFNG